MRKNVIIPFLLSACLLLPAALAAQGANLARGSQATASSSESAAYAPAKAIDGDPATGWASGTKSGAEWLRLDLGSSRPIARVVLVWGIASARDYSLSVSEDGKVWKKIAGRSGQAAGQRSDELAGLEAQGRYLRVSCEAKAKGAAQYSLRELQVFGRAEAAKPAAAAAKPAPAAGSKSGLVADLGCGWALPLGAGADILEPGAYPMLALGWQFPLGPGRLIAGLEAGALFESTKDDPDHYRYHLACVPLGVFAGYDLGLFASLRAYAQVSGGYSASLVDFVSETVEDLCVLKPYVAGAAGLGWEFGRFEAKVGGRILAVFYESVSTQVAPELRLSYRF
jgi:hypothetical protein